jgi:hypothetical protein
MDVRLARPTDAAVVLALALDDRAHLVKDPLSSGVRTTIGALGRSVFPLAFQDRMWIACDGSDIAMLEARPRKYVIGWDILRLAARGGHDAVVKAVLDEAMEHLHRRGIPRLFARCRGEAEEEMLSLGFRPLGHEYLLLGSAGHGEDVNELPDGSRYRMPQDAWPLHQLENAVTPPLIRQLEGSTSAEWAQDARRMSEIVVERDGHAVAWVGWGSRAAPRARRLGLLVHPDYRDVAPVLLRHVLSQSLPGTAFLARVRDFQSELLPVFYQAGFRLVGEEALMVRQGGVVPVRARPAMRPVQVPGIQAFPFVSGISPARAVAAGPAQKDTYP